MNELEFQQIVQERKTKYQAENESKVFPGRDRGISFFT